MKKIDTYYKTENKGKLPEKGKQIVIKQPINSMEKKRIESFQEAKEHISLM